MNPAGSSALKLTLLIALATQFSLVRAASPPASEGFRKEIQPVLQQYCYDCHGDGMNKGGVAFDELKSDDALLNHELWSKVLKNLRAGLMPPAKKPRPSAEEQQRIETWIKYSAFGIDPRQPDPGRVTVRRLNRIEYRNTIRDLMGIDFHSEVEFPPDDTGYGFDNIGDVLTVSPMLLEKYLAASKAIVAEAVPLVSKVIPETTLAGSRFQAASSTNRNRGSNRRETMLPLSYYEPAAVGSSFTADHGGKFRLSLQLAIKGGFDFNPAKCRLVFKVDDRELLRKEFGWEDNKTLRPLELEEPLAKGEHRLSFELEPLTPVEQKLNPLEMRLVSVTIRGPLEPEHWTRPKNYDRFFTRDAPESPTERRAYAREVLRRFTDNAFRRPVDDPTLERLIKIAEAVSQQPGKSFENGIAQAMVAVLASPRFLFRMEESEPAKPSGAVALVDEYSLASRLSYFLWSSMPDEELFQLAGKHQLRSNLSAQVKRMLADPRSEGLVENFSGQWLQTRDVEGITIDARVVLARDDGLEQDLKRAQEEFRARIAARKALAAAAKTNAVAQSNLVAQANSQRSFNRRLFQPRVELDQELRTAMRRETEMYFGYVVHEDRSVLELIDSDYTFLNQKLAGFYGLTNLDVTGSELHRATLPSDSPRGGVLTHGSVLVVTSNPDRTSPVKRGLFILDNFLGTPSPPPPPNIPALEAAEKDIKEHEPTLRESLAVHRDKPLCASCHARLDPIGLAFENFNAMGMWRDKERKQSIEPGGQLVTGETFNSVSELKHILSGPHRLDYYRCLTEKLLTYATGRGMEYYDVETMDRIVQRLEREQGRFSALLMGVIESAPFQQQRKDAAFTSRPAESNEKLKENVKNPRQS